MEVIVLLYFTCVAKKGREFFLVAPIENAEPGVLCQPDYADC